MVMYVQKLVVTIVVTL